MLPAAAIGISAGAILLLQRNDDAIAPSPEISGEIDVPLTGITRKQWIDFLHIAVCGNPRTVNPSFRLGTFGLTVRRLCDLGAMTNPRTIDFDGRQVWDAKWTKPISLRAFQASPMTQYQLFASSVAKYDSHPDLTPIVGACIDGMQITRSGALMLAHRAGLNGAKTWIESHEIRRRFSDNTTQYVIRANGIF